MEHFTSLPDNARAWVYQSDREFTDAEVSEIEERISGFTAEWASHQRDVTAMGKVLYKRFIVLCADESQFQVSGCSIDSSVRFIKEVEQSYGLNLFDRMSVAYREGDHIETVARNGFQQLVSQGKVNANTIVFNNMITTKAELNTQWEVPAAQSWHAQVFKLAVRV